MDADEDGFGNPDVTIDNSCDELDGYVSDNTDCDDSDNTTYPGAAEVCDDGVDNNCNGFTDEGCDCSPKGETCDHNSDCCSGKCLDKPGKKRCK